MLGRFPLAALLYGACSYASPLTVPKDDEWPPGFVAAMPEGLPPRLPVFYKDILLDHQAAAYGEQLGDLEHVFAFTNWSVEVGRIEAEGEPCRVVSVVVRFYAYMAFFRAWWYDPDSELFLRWRRLQRRLVDHELKHYRRGVDTAAAIESTLVTLPPQSNCDAARGWASETASYLLRRSRLADDELDATEGQFRFLVPNQPRPKTPG